MISVAKWNKLTTKQHLLYMSQECLTPVPQTRVTVTSLFTVGFHCVLQPALKVLLVLLEKQKLTQHDVCLYKYCMQQRAYCDVIFN